jgi:signal peptidase I
MYQDNLSGDIYVWKDFRNPKNMLSHLLTKISMQNVISQFITLKYFRHRFKRFKAMPGDVVYFNGFRSLHFNDPSDHYISLVVHQDLSFENNPISKYIIRMAQNRVRQ